ncbi:zinc finger domain-containing protein [Streptomyces syringium]|uniref:zinc finger domain-containing protein n=1 Tax=Streptomyces syringium TaxID=76729 RepID=UPI003F53ECB5
MNGDLDETARAELVEREPCPRCGAAPGSACRANSGVVAVDYHTGRHAKIPGMKSGPAIRIPAARGPGLTWAPFVMYRHVEGQSPIPLRLHRLLRESADRDLEGDSLGFG